MHCLYSLPNILVFLSYPRIPVLESNCGTLVFTKLTVFNEGHREMVRNHTEEEY